MIDTINQHSQTAQLIRPQTNARIPSPAEALQMFLTRCKTVNTRKSYRSAINSFFSEGCPNDPIIFSSLVTTDRILAWLRKMEGKGGQPQKSQTTIVQRFSVLNQFMMACTVWGVLPVSPINKFLIDPPDAPEWEPSLGLMTKDINAMRDACLDDPNRGVGLRDHAIIALGFAGCLRVSEIHYSSTNHFIRSGRRVRLALPKTKSGLPQRVDIPAEVKSAVEDYILEVGGLGALKPERSEMGDVCRPTFVSLSPTSYGHRLSASYISKMIKQRGAEAGIEINVHSHLLRHSGITHLFELGWPPEEIQRHARHKSITTTYRYKDLWEETMKPSPADALGKLLGKRNGSK